MDNAKKYCQKTPLDNHVWALNWYTYTLQKHYKVYIISCVYSAD